MPRFFFRARKGEDLLPDPEGTDLPDLAAARAEAVASFQQLAPERAHGGSLSDVQTLEISDEAGQVLAIVSFHDALKSLE
jgi:hypothetical protein